MSDTTNGGTLPLTREAIVEQGNRIHQEVCAERDALRLEVGTLKTEIAGFKAMLEVAELNVTQLESHVQSATLTRDQAIADRAVYETLFISIQAQMRAFQVPAAPLVREKTEDHRDALEAMQEGYFVSGHHGDSVTHDLLDVGRRRDVPKPKRSPQDLPPPVPFMDKERR